jgi:hypothetical protein
MPSISQLILGPRSPEQCESGDHQEMFSAGVGQEAAMNDS